MAALLGLIVIGCYISNSVDTNIDSGTDADTDTDTDTDINANTEKDTDSYTNADTDTDCDADSDNDQCRSRCSELEYCAFSVFTSDAAVDAGMDTGFLCVFQMSKSDMNDGVDSLAQRRVGIPFKSTFDLSEQIDDELFIPYDQDCEFGDGWTWTDNDCRYQFELCKQPCSKLASGEWEAVGAAFACQYSCIDCDHCRKNCWEWCFNGSIDGDQCTNSWYREQFKNII